MRGLEVFDVNFLFQRRKNFIHHLSQRSHPHLIHDKAKISFLILNHFKYGPILASIFVNFRPFLIPTANAVSTILISCKSIDGVLGIRTWAAGW